MMEIKNKNDNSATRARDRALEECPTSGWVGLGHAWQHYYYCYMI